MARRLIACVATDCPISPPQPTPTLEPRLSKQDVYEVRIYDSRRNWRLAAAIEIVSPSNKDRPETRGTFRPGSRKNSVSFLGPTESIDDSY